MFIQLILTLNALVWRLPIFANIKEAVVDWQALALNRRLLVLFGYLLLAGMLFFMLVTELLGGIGRLIIFSLNETDVQIPFGVMVVSSLGFAVGWSFILTGATDFRRRVFWLILGLYAVQLFLLMPTNNAAIIWLCTAPPLQLLIIGIHSYGRQREFIRQWPLTEFSLWVIINFFFLGLFWFWDTSDASVATALNANFGLLMLLTVLFWATSGLTVAQASIAVGRGIVMVARWLFPGRFLRVLVLALVLVRPLLSFAAAVLAFQSDNLPFQFATFLDILITVPLTLWMLLWVASRRWQLEQAMTLLGLSLGLPVLTVGIGLAFLGQDITDFLAFSLESIGLFPPLLLFTALLIHELLTAGLSFALRDSESMPRSGRIFLVFGAALLMISFTLFNVNTRNVTTGEIHNDVQIAVNNLFAFSALFLGIPYLGWIVWRRRETLIGDESEYLALKPLFADLDRIHWGVWLAVGLGIMFSFSCLLCLLTFILVPTH